MNELSSNSGRLPQPQKIAVSILAVLAVLIVIFWVWQMKAQINHPFSYPLNANVSQSASSTDIAAVLKSRDTDGDGLSDYDEIYVYHTSPYLEDTDSDGIPDKKEIDQGTDPNCPQGQNCNALAPVATGTPATLAPLESASTTPENLNASGTDSTALQNALSGKIDAATLRQLLIASGANKAELEKISDVDLMKSYQETLNKQNQTQ